MPSHPYESLPNYTRWSRAVARPAMHEVDPVVGFPFKITAADKVATAGSCFAQHIARHLRKNGFNYFIAEDGHPIGDEALRDRFGYGTYSARYGNIYTSRQLHQLLRRAYGEFVPVVDHWRSPKVKGFIDPFRPTIQADGFATLEELRRDREQHLARVRYMIENLDYFVFTLGLTETWFNREDGAVFPICPGVSGGEYDESKTGFVNLSAYDVVADMKAALGFLFAKNPKAKVILTVSPVPLAATALHRHVLTSTTLSKSVLRVAAEVLSQELPNVAYFPSYEIITGAYTRGSYFAEDLRSVTEAGVEHVMGLFLKHGTNLATAGAPQPVAQPAASSDHLTKMAEVVQALCDEAMLDSDAH